MVNIYNKTDVKNWLNKAEDDILWAEASFKNGFYSPTCFIAQQIAEKALKAYIFSLQEDFTPSEIKRIRTHDLNILIQIASEKSNIPKRIRENLKTLNEFYLPTRYPDIPDPVGNYTKEVALEAQERAKVIVDFVKSRLKPI